MMCMYSPHDQGICEQFLAYNQCIPSMRAQLFIRFIFVKDKNCHKYSLKLVFFCHSRHIITITVYMHAFESFKL